MNFEDKLPSTASTWDPLEAANSSDKEFLTESKRREIKNILKSYVGSYDPMSELIQNAMDAIERFHTSANSDFIPKIKIKIDLKENSMQVVDNGGGFSEEQFRSFLAPNISYKKDENSRGNKGVGATYIAYGFNHLEIRTKNNSFKFEGRFRSGRDWIEDATNTISRPHVEPVNDNDSLFEALDHGTSVKLIFGGKNTRPSSLAWYQATTPAQWEYLLLVKTPLGHISFPDGNPCIINFDLEVTDLNGNQLQEVNKHSKYKYPHEEIKASCHLSSVKTAQLKAISESKDPVKAIEKYCNSNGAYEFYGVDDIAAFKNLENFEINLVKQYKVSAYGYFAYSTSIWDQLNDVKAKLRKGFRILRGGLQMANNHMVQGELITIPLNKSIGYQNQAHILVHFCGADPDLGRKGFQPELKQLSEKISVAVLNQLSARRDILKNDSGAAPDIEKEIKVHDWIRMQEQHEKEHPLTLKNENFFLPTRKISVRSVPLSEQDVIVLFNQLLAGGVIRGIRLLSTSQTAQYDGIFRYAAEEPLSDLAFNEIKNPLGVHDEQLTKEYQGPPKIIEYKFSLDGLVREFESAVKSEKDVSLAVFWEFGEEYKREYTVTSLLDFNNTQHRQHHGLTHVIKSANSKFDAICLKELMSLLNEPVLEQKVQQAKYSDTV